MASLNKALVLVLALAALLLMGITMRGRGGMPGAAFLNGAIPDKCFLGCTNNGETPMYDVLVHWQGDVCRFSLRNLTKADITFDFNLDLSHMRAASPLPCHVVLSPGEQKEAVAVRCTSAEWSYRYQVSCTFGRPDAVPDATFVYRLPYADGASHTVVQGYGGSFSHHDDDSWYSLDFNLPEGTPVVAVREGVVALVINNYSAGGITETYRNKANLVLIRQPDDTYAEYDHLEKGSMLVKAGDAVREGQPIARSGATGYASGPHLHLCIFKGRDGLDRQTLPTRFHIAGQSDGQLLEEGGTYTAQ